jgi:hypothetical protein
MSCINLRQLESIGDQIVRVMTVSDREDRCLGNTILSLEEIRTTRAVRDVSTTITSPTRERCKIAVSVCKLPYIDFHIDGRKDCCSDAVEDYYTACNMQNKIRNL